MPNKPLYPSLKPFIVHIGIDGVSLTGSYPELKDHFPQYIKAGVERNGFQFEHEKMRYFYAAKVRIGTNPNGGLILYCRGDGQWMARWNPSYMSINDDIRIREVLNEYLKQAFDDLWQSRCISRCDLAIDIAHMRPDMVICRRKLSRKFHCIANGSGYIETIYFGENPVTTALYNKRLQLEDVKLSKMRRNGNIQHDILTPLKFDLMRIEERQYQLEPISLLDNPYNPLDRLQAHWHHELYSCKTIPELLLDSCRLRGIKNALKLVSDTQSKFVLDEMSRYKNILSDIGETDNQIRQAYTRLLVIAPQKIWKSHLAGIPKPLWRYIHTGYITRHFIQLAFGRAPSKEQVRKLATLGYRLGKSEFSDYELLGQPITYTDASELILIKQRSE